MKIGILTFHNNENRGSILQAYCLKESLEDLIEGADAEVIDYRTISHEILRIASKNPIEVIKNIKSRSRTEKEFSKLNILSKNRKITNNYQKAVNFLSEQNYDMIIVGSDTIWKIDKKKSLNRPFPNVYFLDESIDAIKVSYAASANKTYLEELKDSERRLFENKIKSFDKISVRDNYTEKILNKIGIKDFKRVPDPTILTEIPTKDISEIFEKNEISLDKPIISINRVKKDFMEEVISDYKSKGYQIISPTKHPLADVNLYSKLSPFEYYSLYDYFDLSITGSLHSTIFSIKNKTPFVTIETSNKYKKAEDSKTHSLLKDFEMMSRYIDGINKKPENLLNKVKKCEKDLDEEKIEKKLSKLKEEGQSYIKELGKMLND